MPACQNCQQTWTWFQSVKNMFRLKCPYCGMKQYQSASFKKKASYFNIVPIMIVFFINIFFPLTIGIGIIFLLLLLALIVGTIPFYLKLSNEEEFWF